MLPKSSLSVSTALVCVVLILLSAYHYTQVSSASCKSPIPLHERVAPYGVGLDLTASYGTAAVHYYHGSSAAISKVNGTADYVSMMKRLSLNSAWHLCPPYLKISDRAADVLRQLKRRLRKYMGLPATPEVAVLAVLLQSLRFDAEQYLGHSLESFVVTFPRMIGICEEDITDAIDYVGLRPLQLPPQLSSRSIHQPYELEAAYMGSGLGLCAFYTNPQVCNEEADTLPTVNVLSIYYSRHALAVEAKNLSRIGNSYEPYAFPPYQEAHDAHSSSPTNFELGSDSLPSTIGGQHAYWDRVRNYIQRDLHTSGNPLRRNITDVLLQGESALDTNFLRVLREALQEIAGHRILIHSADPTHVAAKGAAVMAMRIYDTLGFDRENSSEGKQGQ